MATTALLAGCVSTQPETIPGSAAAPVAAQWHAPLPHGGQLGDLSRWWAQFDDPLMLRLIEAGQQVSPTVAQAAARIADAQAARVAQSAALLPSLDASASASRGRTDLDTPVGTETSAGLQLGWELDLFGAGRAGVNAAQARLESSQADWHDARVSVAAEIATTYVELRACEALAQQAEIDTQSRVQTAQVTRLTADKGFRPPAEADLANASAAQGNVTLIEQRTQCELLVKALSALAAQDEAALRRELATTNGRLPRPAELSVTAMPAEVLAQRPDIHAAARDVVAASADSDQARAQRWPRIGLAGSIGTTRISSGGISTNGSVWSIGPLTVTLPLFDGGTRRANAEAARARYEAATTVYAARLREAIRDVEDALVTLDSTAKRSEDAAIAADGFERSYQATEASYRIGTASLFELEDARRSMVAAQSAVIELQRERITAWIRLYRALGGGWPADENKDHDNE
ncbi:efflux transporter outer membrane subunit [Halomonas sp. LR3S48]|uniref:efflux transporter outer membrane subunit n=1 Tax=Halomonas sp. LR3S48 TaxID=2982694 RepID=UPI0021E3D6D3|nr:efflux transporter outer membrane subunit [Halomonas sp. LR3S48]UYG04406.1 efflux transporter outer membrane subunit [Halomonas sp. LR3S48]